MIEPATALAFSVYENKGVYALLLGSGVSRASQIPTGWEIVLDLTRRIGTMEGVTDQADWAAWYRGRFLGEPNYSTLLDTLSRTPDERRSILHHYIEPTPDDLEEGRKLPTQAHRAAARLVRDGFVRVIVTTNFDRLLESALRDEGVEPTIIASDDDLTGAVPLIHSRCYVIKLHGDYLDTRIRNTEEELKGYSDAMNCLLDRVLDEHGMIVCGWSADWDHALRAAFTRAPNRRYPLYWASRGEPSEAARALITARHGVVVQIASADAFFSMLQQKVEAQASLQRVNPNSVALLVATAKKYLSKPEYRIQLHDLVGDEVKRLQQVMMEPGLGPYGQWSPEEFRRRVARWECACEPLVVLFATIGRWGREPEFQLCSDVLGALGKKRVLGGLVRYINLRTYPAVLLLYAYGIGTLRAGRLDILLRWFSVPIEGENSGEASSAVESLFLGYWPGHDRESWQYLEGLESRITPLSDHLHDVLKASLVELALYAEDFELLFERFELMGSLANATLAYSEQDLEHALSSDRGQGYARIPVGRMGWRSQGWRTLAAEVERPEFRTALLSAGFLRGRDDALSLAMQNMVRVAARMRF